MAYPYGTPGLGNIQQPAMMLGDRGGFNWHPQAVGGFSASYHSAVDRLDDEFFIHATDGRSPAAGGFTARFSLMRITDAFAGVVHNKATPQALAGNLRLTALSATLAVVGFTTGSQYGTYRLKRDVGLNILDGADVVATVGEQGIVPADMIAYSATKYASIRINSGRTARLTMVTVDPDVAAPANPFTNGPAGPTFDLTTTLAGSVAADAIVIAAVERVGADRILVVSRNITRGLMAAEIFDLT